MSQRFAPPEDPVAALLAAPLLGPVSMSLPFSAESAGMVRRALASWLGHQGSGAEVIGDVSLVATELVSNAVRHAAPLVNGTILVRWRREADGLWLTVSDGGGLATPTVVRAGYDDEQGRGLAIVDALGLRWWAERTQRIHSVHVQLRLR